MPNDTNLLTTAQAAERAGGVHVRTIHRWVESGRLAPTHKLPGVRGAYLFAPDAVDEAIATAEADMSERAS